MKIDVMDMNGTVQQGCIEEEEDPRQKLSTINFQLSNRGEEEDKTPETGKKCPQRENETVKVFLEAT